MDDRLCDRERIESLVESSKEVIEEAFDKYSNIAVAWSGGKDSTAMVFLINDVIRENSFVQPLYLVGDPVPMKVTNEYIISTARELGIPFNRLVWYHNLIKKEYLDKVGVVGKDKKKCCYWLKVVPLNDFIRNYNIEALFVSIRWDEHPERSKEKYFSKREDPPHIRVHPMLHWAWDDILCFFKLYNIRLNPLYYQGYTSLGCEPCTSKVKPSGFRDIDELIIWARKHIMPERAGRDIDKEKIMENLRRLGYF